MFFSLILLPLIAFGGALSDAALYTSAGRACEGAADVALSSVMSGYDKRLFELYGLFGCCLPASGGEAGVEYFDKTLNTDGLFDLSDGYARVLLNRLFGSGSGIGNRRYGLLETDRVNYSVRTVSESCLANPPVLERQIIEYMKYRGPVAAAASLAERAGVFKDLGKSGKAASSKLKYESRLGKLQEAADGLCDALDGYLERLEGGVFDRDSRKKAADFLREYLEAAEDALKKAAAASYAESLSSELESYLSAGLCPEEDEIGAASARLELIVSGTTYGMLRRSAANTAEMSGYIASAYIDLFTGGFEVISEAARLSSGLSKLPAKSRSEIVSRAQEVVEVVKSVSEKTRRAADIVYSRQGEELQDAGAGLSVIKSEAEELARLSSDLSAAALLFYQTASDLYPELEKWKRDVDDLPEGELKRGMLEQISAEDVKLDVSAAAELSRIASERNDAFGAAAESIGTLTVRGVRICGASEKEIKKYAAAAELTGSEADSESQTDAVCRILPVLCDREGFGDESGRIGAFLEELYAARSERTFREAENKLADTVGSLLSETSDMADAGKNETPLRISECGGECVRLINFYAGAAGLLADAELPGISVTGDDAEEVTESAGDTVSLTGSFLSSAADFLTGAGEDLLVCGYLTGVFSCTGDSLSDTNLVTGHDFSNSVFFGKEIEYLIYGKDLADENVVLAALSVFGVRFVLNTIYALTDAYLQQSTLAAATAVAGWSGFGVPLVQNLMLIALALAESISDTVRLTRGESVAVWKNPEVWRADPAGLIGGLVSGAAGEGSDSGTVCFSYRDYMTLLLAACYPAAETRILARCAKLIQINMYAGNAGFALTSAGTVFVLDAEVSAKGSLLRSLVPSGILSGAAGLGNCRCTRIAGY